MNFKIISVFLVVLLGFVAYSNSFGGKFIWDDEFLVRDNAYIKSPSVENIKNIFSKNIGAGAERIFEPYRPLQIFTYLLDNLLWKEALWGYHFTNVLLHILVAISIFWLINILFQDKVISLLTGLLYVVHPVHTEAVSFISGRADPLCFLFLLLSFVFYIKQQKSDKLRYYVIMILSYSAAVFSREMSLILPVALILYHYAFQRQINLRGSERLNELEGHIER